MRMFQPRIFGDGLTKVDPLYVVDFLLFLSIEWRQNSGRDYEIILQALGTGVTGCATTKARESTSELLNKVRQSVEARDNRLI